MTAPQTPFRPLRFASADEAVAEARSLAAAAADGALRSAGTWSLGQALGHVAAWIDYAYDGYPPGFRPSWPVRTAMRLLKGRVLRKGMPRGLRFPKVPGGTFGIDDYPPEERLRRFIAAFDRLAASAPTTPSPAFGPLDHEQWLALHLRHAELHLGHFTVALEATASDAPE
jgi:hypothetical protein